MATAAALASASAASATPRHGRRDARPTPVVGRNRWPPVSLSLIPFQSINPSINQSFFFALSKKEKKRKKTFFFARVGPCVRRSVRRSVGTSHTHTHTHTHPHTHARARKQKKNGGWGRGGATSCCCHREILPAMADYFRRSFRRKKEVRFMGEHRSSIVLLTFFFGGGGGGWGWLLIGYKWIASRSGIAVLPYWPAGV